MLAVASDFLPALIDAVYVHLLDEIYPPVVFQACAVPSIQAQSVAEVRLKRERKEADREAAEELGRLGTNPWGSDPCVVSLFLIPPSCARSEWWI